MEHHVAVARTQYSSAVRAVYTYSLFFKLLLCRFCKLRYPALSRMKKTSRDAGAPLSKTCGCISRVAITSPLVLQLSWKASSTEASCLHCSPRRSWRLCVSYWEEKGSGCGNSEPRAFHNIEKPTSRTGNHSPFCMLHLKLWVSSCSADRIFILNRYLFSVSEGNCKKKKSLDKFRPLIGSTVQFSVSLLHNLNWTGLKEVIT